MTLSDLTEKIINHCRKNNLKKIYICGNGGAGKSTLSKSLSEFAKQYGNVNLISTDDFLVDTELRKNSKTKWQENNVEFCDRYTSSNKESYFFKNIYEILYNLENGNDCYYFPKRYKEKNIRKLYADNALTIIEGVGTAFLEINYEKSFCILLECNKEEETKRRSTRTIEKNRDNIELYNANRSSQYRVNVLPLTKNFNLIVESNSHFEYIIKKEI